jgi:hypothetical protein
MRGGITYPRAIAKGAYGVKRREDHLQGGFKDLPGEVSTDGNGETVLEWLFQPQPETRRRSYVLMAGLEPENMIRKLVRLAAVLCLNYWPFAVLGAAIAVVPLLASALASTLSGLAFWPSAALGLIVALTITIAVAAGGAAWDALDRLPKNGYSLCSGSSNLKDRSRSCA